jgi:hypothetical protein
VQKHVEMTMEVQAIADGIDQLSLDLASVTVSSEALQYQETLSVAKETKPENKAAEQQSVKLPTLAPPKSIELTKPKPQLLYIPPKKPQRPYQQPSPQWLKMMQGWYQQSWLEEFCAQIPWERIQSLFDPLLGHLKVGKPIKTGNWPRDYPLQIHRLEKDLVYLIAIAIAKKSQLFLSLPIFPSSLGILTVAYYATLSRDERNLFNGNHTVTPKHFVIWIRPRDNGQVQNLRIVRTVNDRVSLSNRIVCVPSSKFDENVKESRLKVVTVRSLEEGRDLLKQSKYCSLVVLDDDLGRTYPSPSQYGNEAFNLASLCQQKQIPMIGVVPPWSMRTLEWHENKHQTGIGLWAVDLPALCSYPLENDLFRTNILSHPIEESFWAINQRRGFPSAPRVTLRTFSLSVEDEERIANAFQEASALLIALGNRPDLRQVWGTGWEIWRDLSAPVLPSHLLWDKFLEGALKRLEAAAERCGEPQALVLYRVLHSLAVRLQKLSRNPFVEWLEKLGSDTTIAIADISRLSALNDFLLARGNSSVPRITTIRDLQGQAGTHLVVIGQTKARYRSFLQTCFFQKVDVLLWAALADGAEHLWSGLEIDSRAWHIRTWRSLTQQEVFGRYGYSYRPIPVEIEHQGTTQLNRGVDISRLEEQFSQLSQTSLDSGFSNSNSNELNTHYYVAFEGNFQIRVSTNSEFLVLIRRQAQVVSVRELVVDIKVVLFEGMNRDELFAQKAGLLEETRANWQYRTLLGAWRELVKERVQKLNNLSISRQIYRESGVDISEAAIQTWLNGDDLLTLPRLKEHFLWFIPTRAHSGFEEFWNTANDLRKARRQLGRVISECAQEGWRDRNPDDIVFQYQRVFITVGELRDAMQILQVLRPPELIAHPPAYPINRLFRNGAP